MSTKFLNLWNQSMRKFLKESTFQRGTQNFLTGDVVKIIKNYLDNDEIKKMPQHYLDKLKEWSNSDKTIRVSCVKNKYASNVPGDVVNSGMDSYADITLEKIIGYPTEILTVPVGILEFVPTGGGHNLAAVADSLKRPDNSVIHPKVVNDEDSEEEENSPGTGEYMTRLADRGDKKLTKTDSTLKNKNVVLPNAVLNKKNPSQGFEYSTYEYMPKDDEGWKKIRKV